MQKNAESYYQPYLSDSEDSSSITSSDTSDTEDSMTRDPIGSQKFLTQLGGINLDPVDKQIGLRIQPKVKRGGIEYSEFDISGVKPDDMPFTGTKFDMASGTYTTILMINSRDRDSQVYPQPTFFTIRLPRTYRNITSFQITQMKLLSSFFYFRDSKGNTTMDVLEQGRTITDNGQTVDNIITVRIREGTYNIDSLLSELQTQLNRTPLFFYYPNGFSDFITQFTAAGDLSVNFNQPGDNFYNTLTDQFIQNPTIEQIVTTYFATRYAGLSIYTLAQVKVAYYYPVLYEMILDPQYASQLNLELSPTGAQLLPGETVKSRIVYTFQGLNDAVILEIIDNNLNILVKPGVSILDNYRTLNTFIYSLVNEYNCSYEQNNNRVIISTSRLNTSLFNLLNQQAALALVDVLNTCNLTLQQYSNLLLSNTLYTAVFTNMYNFMQSNFALNFAVNFGTYTPVFFTNITNAPYLQNGIGAVGVATGYTLAVLQSGKEPINSSTQNLRSFPPYWPQITSTPPSDVSGNVMFVGSGLDLRVQDISASIINVVYNPIGSNVQTSRKLIDNSGNIFINPTFGAGDCVTPILNSQYTVFRFRSYVRQTLQVETLPLPYYYRFPIVNTLNFNAPIPDYFDLSYSYVNSQYLTRTDISSVTLNFPQSYTTAYTAAKDFLFTVNSSRRFYTFTAPTPRARTGSNAVLRDASGYKYPLTISLIANNVIGQPIVSPAVMNAYFYHDQGAFYADVSANRNENPYHYKEFIQLGTDVSSVSFTTNVFAQNQYYMIVRSSNVSFQNTRLKVMAYYPNQYSTPIARYQFQQNINPFSTPTLNYPVTTDVSYNQIYAIQYDRDFIRLPTASNLMGADPSSQGFNEFLPVTEVPIGYDLSGVSTDLTDYKGYNSNILGNVPFASIRADPVSRFNFQSLSPYNPQTSNYFYAGGSNSLLAPVTNRPYTAKRVPYRQFKIVNWYDTQYIAPQAGQPGIPNSNFLARSSVVDASYGKLSGYTYDASQNAMTFQGGVIGFSFLPQEGIWDVDQVVFKSAYMERSNLAGNFTDPNKKIKYLGVFTTGSVFGSTYADISLNTAIVKLDLSGVYPYTPEIRSVLNTFDNTGGTYFRYVRDSNFTSAGSGRIAGYTPSEAYVFDVNSYYSLLAFDNSQNIIPLYTLMGSYVPYPPVSYPYVVNPFEPSQEISSFVVPTGGLVKGAFPASFYIPQPLSQLNSNYYNGYNNPPTGTYNQAYWPPDGDIFQSRYEQSMPIKTTLLHTAGPTPTVGFSNALKWYPTDSNETNLWFNPPGSNLTLSNVNLSNTFMGGFPVLSKGPYFIMLNNNFTASNTSNGTIMNFQYVVASNNYINYSNIHPYYLSNINWEGRTWSFGPAFSGTPSNLDSIYSGGALKRTLGFAWNDLGSNDTDGMYVMRQIEGGIYPGSGSAQGIRFEIAQVTLNSKFGTMTTTPIKTFWVGPEVVNGIVNTPTVSILASNSIYADINFSKFYYTNKKLAYFQFALEYDHGASAITNGPSYWGLYDVSNDSVRQFVCPANGITPGGPPIPVGYPWASPLPYFWDTLQSPESSYFDWTVTPKGSLYILSGQTLQRNPIGYAYIQKYTFDSSGNFGFYYGYLANLDILLTPDVNQNIQKVYGLGAFNKIAVDAYDNIYLSFAYPKTPYFFQYGLFNYQFSSGLWGYYGFVSSNAIATAYDSLFNQQATGGGPQPVVSLNNQVVTPFFQISKQQLYFYPIANGSNGLGPDAPLVPYDILIGNSKLPGAPSPIYFPATNLQLLNYGISIQSIKCPYTTSNVIPDISGVYTINTQLFTNTESGYGSTVQVTLRPNMTNFQIAAAYNTAISNVTFKNPNVIVTIPEDSTEIITVPAPPIWLPTSLQFRVRSYKLYFPVTIFPESVGTPTAIYDGSVYSDVSSTRVNGFVTLSDPTLASLYFPTPPVYGNSATTFDLTPPSINNAWQIMYPTTKIVLRKLQNGFTPITDTTDLTTYPSYEHTSMFFYDNYSDLSNDIFNKFGQESASRFKAYDVSSGYFFYSYIYNIQLQPFKGNSLDISSNNGYNFLAVRAYSPCENFNCLTRFYLPGRYDFGFIALQDLSNETQTVLVDLSGSKLVNPTYATVLNQFNNAFKGNFRFGSNAVPGFSGSNYTFNGFGQFLNQYIKNYNSGTSNANILAGITSNVQSNVSQYIQTYLSDILPSYVLNRERFTDPLLFSLLFKSGLSDVRRDLEYEWGLGWNLGFPKIDTPYDTIQRATSFFKILDDYIYLRLNQEFWMNRLDSSGKENLSITHESQGQTNQFAAKLLLANFGSYAQTMIQNPITFNPVLTSIDRLSFQWVDLAGVQIDNLDCEWNAAVQITEQVTQATPNSTIPRAAPLK